MRLATGWGPAWSSRGQIAYVDGRPGAYDIFVMDADGTDATNITTHRPVTSTGRAGRPMAHSWRSIARPAVQQQRYRRRCTRRLRGRDAHGSAGHWRCTGLVARWLDHPGRPVRAAGREYGLEVYDARGLEPGRSILADGHTGYDSWQALTG